MADKLRDIRPKLIKSCSEAVLLELMDELLHQKILSELEVESIIQGNALRADKCRLLIDIVIGKGDDSCNVLLQEIREKNLKLSENLGITAPVEPPTKKDQSSQQDINGITLCSEAEYQEITTKETVRYPIYDKANRKRWALIICNINFEDEAIKERKGADIDLKEMTKLLEGFGYNVRSESNLTAEEMQNTMKSFAAHTDHSQSDSTFLVFMSHGAKNIIYGTDVKKDVARGLHVDEIFDMFNNGNCPGLQDKPKMILIQACRGSERSQVWVRDDAQQPENINQEDLEADALRLMHKESDFICFYSTTPDTVSYRDPAKGSLFIQSLIKFMKEDAHNLSIEDIFRKVRYSFQKGKQMPTLERTTSLKTFFLFPGY